MVEIEKANWQLLVNSIQNTNGIINTLTRKVDDLQIAVINVPNELKEDLEKRILQLVPNIIDRAIVKHKKNCPLNKAGEKATEDTLTNLLLPQEVSGNTRNLRRPSIPAKLASASKLDKIPKAVWYLVGGAIAGILGKKGIEMSDLFSLVSF